MLYQLIGLICIIIGFLLIYINQYYRYKFDKLPEERIEYRYLPRTAREQLDDPIFPSDIFETMFSQPDPWILSLNDLDTRRRENLNKYFISAL
jgi:hypothetical protein